VAHVVMPGAAPLAGALALAERHQHAVALLPARDVLADLLDHTAELVSADVRELRGHAEPGPVARPEVPVASTDAVGLDAKDDAVRRRAGIGHVTHHERLAVCFHHGGSHDRPPSDAFRRSHTPR